MTKVELPCLWLQQYVGSAGATSSALFRGLAISKD